jgi:heme exporter protein CcmD
MSAFFAMGGYGAYVWPAYGISLVSLAVAIGLTLRSYRRAKALLAATEEDDSR